MVPHSLHKLLAATVIVILFAGHGADAQRAKCTDQLLSGTSPVLINEKLKTKTQKLCFSGFALLHSGVTRTPLWSAEHLTAKRIAATEGLDRPSSSAFHAEGRLPKRERAEKADYRGSGARFDRGHMAPNGDMPSKKAELESFSLANVVPQAKCHNEVMWEGIESAVRALATRAGEVYVVTGPGFLGDTIETLNARVSVPTNIFKAIYVPKQNAAGAYWTANNDSQQSEPISIAKLEELIGIDVFPELDASVKATAMALPVPTPHFTCRP